MPESHKAFLRNLEWIHETRAGEAMVVVAVHAGLEDGIPFAAQLEAIRLKDIRISHFECFSGRDNVLLAPADTPANTLVVSGHHGFLHRDSPHREVIDEGGGHIHRALCAIVLPDRTLIRSSGQ